MAEDEVTGYAPNRGEVDIVTFFTTLYERTPAERLQMLARAQETVKSDGLIIVQDFVLVEPERPHELNFAPWYHRDNANGWPYKSYVFDMNQPESGWQSFIDWNSGRCQKMRLGPLARQLMAK
jgi:hypothetical protein